MLKCGRVEGGIQMIVGIGIDMVELNRISDAVQKGEGLALRVLTEKEFAQFKTFTDRRKVEFLGGRFAAKEAVSKALGTGIGSSLSFQQIEVFVSELGAPQMKINAPNIDENITIHVSISHTKTTAIAQVILERVI